MMAISGSAGWFGGCFFGAGREVVSGIGVSLSAKPEIDSDDAIVDFFSLLLDQQ